MSNVGVLEDRIQQLSTELRNMKRDISDLKTDNRVLRVQVDKLRNDPGYGSPWANQNNRYP